MPRSWLFAPGHDEKLLAKVFDADADVVLLDLEDAVPPRLKDRARELVAEAAAHRSCWVRVNRPLTDECESDVAALAGLAKGLRLPKVKAASDVDWGTGWRSGRLGCRSTAPSNRRAVCSRLSTSPVMPPAHRCLMAAWISRRISV